MEHKFIRHNKVFLTGDELKFIKQASKSAKLSGSGEFSVKCESWLEEILGAKKAFLTPSCTAALEMACLLLDLKAGDEVIMPSFTFVSTANAFVIHGVVPVFVDIREDTLNIDENKIEQAITSKTKAIVAVHYAGVGADMGKITSLAKKHKLYVIEDAAQGILAKVNNKYLGTIGDVGALSFHDTKNIIAGEGGALLVNNPKLVERAEIIREKGTNRSQFFRGQVDKYTWVDVGSSYLLGEVSAAFLYAQLIHAKKINKMRIQIWNEFLKSLKPLEKTGLIRLPILQKDSDHNAHLFYILLHDEPTRKNLIDFLNSKNICTVFHYVPLHNSPAGKKYAKTHGDLSLTQNISDRLLRLPLYPHLKKSEIKYIIKMIFEFFSEK